MDAPTIVRQHRPVQPALIRLGSLAISVLAILIAMASPASAHAELASSSPANGSTEAHCPSSISLVFDEAVATGGLAVTINKAGVAPHATTTDNQHFVVAGRSCKPGTVILTWRTVSADDGHVAHGQIQFHVGPTDTAAAGTATTNPSNPTNTWLATARMTGYLCLAVFGGGLLFLTFLWPAGAALGRVRLMITGAAVIGAVAAAMALWATIRASGMSLTFALRLPFGREYAALTLLWTLVAVVVVDFLQRGEEALGRIAWRASAVVLFLAMAAMEAMSAHGYASAHPALGLAADLTHLTAMSTWIGGLVILATAVIPKVRGDELQQVVRRFSQWAQISVAAIVLSGLSLLLIVVVPLPTFWGTHYADVLLTKMTVLILALIAAMGSRTWVKRLQTRANTAGVALIASSVGIETLCALAVLAAAGTLVTSSPGV